MHKIALQTAMAKRRKTASRNIGREVPEHVVLAKILPKSPMLSLIRFKSVCRSWRDVISDPWFVSGHLNLSKKNLKLAIMPREGSFGYRQIYSYEIGLERRRSANFLFRIRLQDLPDCLPCPLHSNGLFLLNTETRQFVFNPMTRESITLPRGSQSFLEPVKAGFAFVPLTNQYKAARYFYRWINFFKNTCSVGFEVFTLGVDASWREAVTDPRTRSFMTLIPYLRAMAWYISG